MKKAKYKTLDRYKLKFEYHQTLREIKAELKSRTIKA